MENVPRENNNNTIDRVAVVDDKEIDLKMENETSLLDATRRRSLKEIGQEKKGKCPDRKMDGGIRGWLIVLSSFLCNGLIFGVINSFSLVYGELQRILESHGVADPSSKAGSWELLVDVVASHSLIMSVNCVFPRHGEF